jgi:ubiquinone/menaquinone biosynthesis C-methylase UbiE
MKPAVAVFDRFASDYDRWFDTHKEIYKDQLAALRPYTILHGRALEVGVGSGRFAAPLGIRYGLDPSLRLLAMARQREIEAIQGTGEFLPYRSGIFDFVLMMTVICFMDNIDQPFQETCRVLRYGGTVVIGFIEKDGEIARQERERTSPGRFLRFAKFRSAEEVRDSLSRAGFTSCTVRNNLHGLTLIAAQKE